MKSARILKSQKGFSLIELMVVVAIIGILATIAIPNFNRFSAKARQSEAKGYLSAIYSGAKAFEAEHTRFVGCINAIGFRIDAAAGTTRYEAGFGANADLPTTYTGACTLNTGAVRGTVNANCSVPAGGATFTACAHANAGGIGAGTTADEWRITQARVMSNSISGL